MPGNPTATATIIASTCNTILLANAQNCRANCSGFVKQVAKKLNVAVPDADANGLVDFLNGAGGWLKLQNNAKQASGHASQGMFVIAGLKEQGNGHVAVVVSGWSPQGFPMGYWGTIRGPQFAGFNTSLTKAWTREDLAKVSYWAATITASATS